MKRFIPALICAAIILALLTPAAAGMPLGGRMDTATIERRTREAAELDRYMLRMQYYNACLLLINNDLLAHRLALAERQLEVERVRLTLGLSTQKNVDALNVQVNGLRSQIEQSEEALQIKKSDINAKRDVPGYDFIGDFSVPTPDTPDVGSVEELKVSLTRNNVALFELNREMNNLSRNEDFRFWFSQELRLMGTQRDLLINQLELAATTGWSAYLDARAQYDLAEESRPLLEARLDLLDEMFRLGEISQIGWLAQRHAVYEELHMADMAAIALAVAVAGLDVMVRGIMV